MHLIKSTLICICFIGISIPSILSIDITTPQELRTFLETNVPTSLLNARPIEGVVAFIWCLNERIQNATNQYAQIHSLNDFTAMKVMLDTRPFSVFARYEYEMHRLYGHLIRRDVGFSIAVHPPGVTLGSVLTLYQGYITSVLHGALLHLFSRPSYTPLNEVYHDAYLDLHRTTLLSHDLSDNELGDTWKSKCITAGLTHPLPPPPPPPPLSPPIENSQSEDTNEEEETEPLESRIIPSCHLLMARHEQCDTPTAMTRLICLHRRICRLTGNTYHCTCV